jgi:hypothetical protein
MEEVEVVEEAIFRRDLTTPPTGHKCNDKHPQRRRRRRRDRPGTHVHQQ